MPRNARAQFLYVAEFGHVGKWSVYDGALGDDSFITGLKHPTALALSGKILFVAVDEGTVGKYNATNGDVINSSFISGLSMPSGLAFFSLRNTLFVADESRGTVRGYNATTGERESSSRLV